MSSGREWSVSIYTLLHLGFHRHKPSEEGIKGKEKEYARGIHMFFMPKVMWICDCIYFYVFC